MGAAPNGLTWAAYFLGLATNADAQADAWNQQSEWALEGQWRTTAAVYWAALAMVEQTDGAFRK